MINKHVQVLEKLVPSGCTCNYCTKLIDAAKEIKRLEKTLKQCKLSNDALDKRLRELEHC